MVPLSGLIVADLLMGILPQGPLGMYGVYRVDPLPEACTCRFAAVKAMMMIKSGKLAGTLLICEGRSNPVILKPNYLAHPIPVAEKVAYDDLE